jgi:hypothetical protein
VKPLSLETVLSLVQSMALILTMAVSVSTLRGRGDDKTVAFTEMQVDIKYIKEKIESVEGIRDVATDARASAKSAHKRIDEHLRYDHHKDVPPHEE